MSASSSGRRCAADDIKDSFSVEACDAAVLGPKRCLSMYVDQPS